MFSDTYRPSISGFGSNWFQFRPADSCLTATSVMRSLQLISLLQKSAPKCVWFFYGVLGRCRSDGLWYRSVRMRKKAKKVVPAVTRIIEHIRSRRFLSCAPLFCGHGIQFQPQMVTWGIAEILLHAQVAFRRLDRGMAK